MYPSKSLDKSIFKVIQHFIVQRRNISLFPMEALEFDATLGGTEELPYSANSLKFAASRSIEIAAMTESIVRPSKTKLIFQTLPVHMRRRVMSHNSKRLPRRLREGHLEQLKKSGLPPKQKRPSRKYRRRPGNLLEEYHRRQKKNMWLETHIWHAKRFHMIERWGHKLAYAPCDKAFRACYRASSAHCLLQDISYYTPIQITGQTESIKHLFSQLTSSSCGLGICAKAFINGSREGSLHLYKPRSYPFGYIGKISFFWTTNNDSDILWLLVHPAEINQLKMVLNDLLNITPLSVKTSDSEIPEKKRKLTNQYDNISVKYLLGTFNRFRLTGLNSHAILVNSLKTVNELETIENNNWIQELRDKFQLKLEEKHEYWQKLKCCSNPSQLQPKMIVGLIVRDPRLCRPARRTKALPNYEEQSFEPLIQIPSFSASSPIWDLKTHETIKKKMLTNAQFIEHVTKTQLVPGEVFLEDPKLQSVPIVLIQRPGSQEHSYKKLGYGSGWDIIVPSKYGLPFWHTFIMFGARSGGLRESENLAFEMGECYFPPDSESGYNEEKRMEMEQRDKYFKLPPSKRVNYVKFGVISPFVCHWKILLKDWSDKTVDDFFVLRDRSQLETIQSNITSKNALQVLPNSDNCLIAVYVHVVGKGTIKRNAMICLPQPGDLSNKRTIIEPNHEDPNKKVRKAKRLEHLKDIRCWRRKRLKLRKNGVVVPKIKQKKVKQEPSEYVKSMRELWLPSDVKSVRFSSSRQVLGHITQGAFSFTEAASCGVGYMPYNALNTLLKTKINQVLIRNTTSKTYRIANIKIVKI